MLGVRTGGPVSWRLRGRAAHGEWSRLLFRLVRFWRGWESLACHRILPLVTQAPPGIRWLSDSPTGNTRCISVHWVCDRPQVCNAGLVSRYGCYSGATAEANVDVIYRRAILKLYISLGMRSIMDAAAGVSVCGRVSDHERRIRVYMACNCWHARLWVSCPMPG